MRGTSDGRRIADVPGLIEGASSGAGPGARLPSPRRADARPRPRRRRLVARPRMGSRGDQGRVARARPGPAREADARRLQQDGPARRPRRRGPPSRRHAAPRAGTPSRSPRPQGRGWTRSVPASPSCCHPLRSSRRRRSRPASWSTGSNRCSTGSSSSAMRDGAFRVRGKRIERIAAQTNFDVEESAERFQRDLARMGVDAELRRAGVGAWRPGPDRRAPSSSGSRSPGRTRDGRSAPWRDRRLRRHVRPDPRRPSRRRRGGTRHVRSAARAVHPGGPAPAQAGAADHGRGPSTRDGRGGGRRATRRSRSAASRSTGTARRTRSTRSPRCATPTRASTSR